MPKQKIMDYIEVFGLDPKVWVPVQEGSPLLGHRFDTIVILPREIRVNYGVVETSEFSERSRRDWYQHLRIKLLPGGKWIAG